MRSLFVTAIVLAFPVIAMPAIIQVPADQPTIQAGIGVAADGDTVLVAPGTYVENIDFMGKAITVQGQQGADVTIIDGNQAGSVVTCHTMEGTDTVLDGFTITNGLGGVYCDSSSPTIINNTISGNSASKGGGIYCYDNSSPTIENNIISGNSASIGGGINCYSKSSPTIINNTISGNSVSATGGGIYGAHNSSPAIINNTISDNSASSNGGGIYGYNNSSPAIINNTISDNSSSSDGGGICCYASSPTIENNIISGNSTYYGGGIHSCNNSTPTITNNIIKWNSATYGGGICCYVSSPTITNNIIQWNSASSGGGIYGYYSSSPIITNTIFWDNSASTGKEIRVGHSSYPSTFTISYSDVDGGQSSCYVDSGCTLNWGLGMIDADPLFLNPLNDDFHLTYDSPCIDAGDNAAPSLPTTDFEDDPRIHQGAVDMGADEFHRHLYYTGEATPGGSIELKFIDLPGSTPVGLYYSVSGVLDPPIPGSYGTWYLVPPVFGTGPIGTIPSNGVMILPIALPPSLPAPFDLYMQAIMGTPLKLTNLCTMVVQ